MQNAPTFHDAIDQQDQFDATEFTGALEGVRDEVNMQQHLKSYEDMNSILDSIPMDPIAKRALSKMLAKGLEKQNYAEYFADVNIGVYLDELLSTHPELHNLIKNTIKIDEMSSDEYEGLDPDEQLRMVVLYKTLQGNGLMGSILSGSHTTEGMYNVTEPGRNNIATIYSHTMRSVVEEINSSFKRDQWTSIQDPKEALFEKKLRDIKDMLADVYGLSSEEISHVYSYLEDFQYQGIPGEPKQSSVGHGFAFALGAVLMYAGMGARDRFMNPEMGVTTNLGEMKLGQLSEKYTCVTAEREFSLGGERIEKLFKESESDGTFTKIGKQVINFFQSNEIAMEINGLIGVEFNFYKESVVTYSEAEGLLQVSVLYPDFTIRDSNTTITKRNTEVITMKDFDQNQQNLIDVIKGKAIMSESANPATLDFAVSSLAESLVKQYGVMASGYKKGIKNVSIEVKGLGIYTYHVTKDEKKQIVLTLVDKPKKIMIED